MAKKEMKGITSVVEWINPDNDKDGTGAMIGLLINLATGGRTAIYSDGLDPKVLAELKKDNVFTHDSVINNGPKGGFKAANLKFERTEAGLTDATLSKFPKKEKKKAEPETKPVVEAEEVHRLEVFGEPIGGDESGEWRISVELDKNNYPVPDKMITFRAGSQKIQKVTDKTGCLEQNITVTENVFARVVVDSSISISNIPVAGPETNVVPKRVYSSREIVENIIFLVWTILLFGSLVYGVYSFYTDLTTPYSARKAAAAQQSLGNSSSSQPKYSWEKSQGGSASDEVVKMQSSSSLSFGWIILWLISGLIWIVMIPLFFTNDIWEAITRTAAKSQKLVGNWVHERKPFQYTVEVTRNKGKIVGQPVYMRDGKVINAPEDKEGLTSKLKDMGFGEALKSFKFFDLASDLGVVLLDRFVLGKIFGGR